jgi:uncharacterized membrane protein (DUF373 family)
MAETLTQGAQGRDAQSTRPDGAGRIHRVAAPLLEGADSLVYLLVALVFLAAAVGMLVYSVVEFPDALTHQGFPLAIVALVNDLLLVMIIMEVLRTVLSYLEDRGGSLRPFLFIAAISATRRVLAIGAQMSVAGEQLTPERFRQAMIDLAANAAVILIIALALFLLDRRSSAGPPGPARPAADPRPEPGGPAESQA